LSRIASVASSTDSNALTTNRHPAAAMAGQTSAWRSTCSTFTVQSNVTSGKRPVQRGDDPLRVVHTVEEVGIAEGHVTRTACDPAMRHRRARCRRR